ncbi:aminopeptidase N [Pleomorphomonas sp. JP5]|uniref:aminopeptidase N n=1 Tax=Pleomorphomonas sp. JP5 TaxID=2942998 RepID=UPI00204431E3|nr:aminopeptidase N [Pleomorphomonas sp. JP5]MCM5558590.1 aminopeptidase N [Pleomorphomonas sp. JP5]
MSHESSPVIRLSDYKPTPYAIDKVDLDFNLTAKETLVAATLAISPRDGTFGEPLVLDGDELTLVRVAIDGRELSQDEYEATPDHLTVKVPPNGAFRLEMTTRLDPAANTKLMGLYRSSGTWCTQCEAEGFRRITYYYDRPDVLSVFTVKITAPKSEAPVLLSNGNPVSVGDLGDGRHFAIWHDPWPKPSYLFALVAGALAAFEDEFTTMSGRKVMLAVYVEKGNAPKAAYAMDSLKRSMKWDEEVFGREYDLDVFNVVAVSDFNMGAMENKGLNVFNDKYVLADPEIATDADYAGIEAVIAHEYFHNWTGDRITCRDWFQLCLKEGLTVFRDQEFSSDMRSRAVKRISDVRLLRSQQFPEDGGPLAHPVRPEQYKEINNFYTATVYEKGAEVIRMLKTLIGDDAFARGMDLYFTRHDGEAATIEQFIACFAEASGRDLEPFMVWYREAGTPIVTVEESWDEASGRFTLTLTQETPATPGQQTKKPRVIPVRFGLVGPDGGDMHPSSIAGAEVNGGTLVLTQPLHTVTFEGLSSRPVPSLFRGFSAPVKVRQALSSADLIFLLANDADSFNRWQAGTTLAMTALVKATQQVRAGQVPTFETAPIDALGALIDDSSLDAAFKALLLAVPSENDVAREVAENVDPDAVANAHKAYRRTIADRLGVRLKSIVEADQTAAGQPYVPDAAGSGRRALANTALDLLSVTGSSDAMDLVRRRFETATNMTDRLAALTVLVHRGDAGAEAALAAFFERFGTVPLVVDKWLSAQASAPLPDTLDRVMALTEHPAFSFGNPNRVRALVGAFATSNPTQFGRADGKGFGFVAGVISRLDAANPQLAARLLVTFRSWRSYEPKRRTLAEAALRSIQTKPQLSRDVADILERTLA